MQSAVLANLAFKVIRDDWRDHGRVLVGMATVMVLAISLTKGLSMGADIARGVIIGVGVVAPYGFSQLCFFIQRQYGLLKPLMRPPVTPVQLVLAKFASAFSMALFVVNVPGLFVRNLEFLFYANVGVLLMTSLCMAVVVISDRGWAALIPLWIVLIPYLYFRSMLDGLFGFVTAHNIAVSLAGICVIPLLVYASARAFEMDT